MLKKIAIFSALITIIIFSLISLSCSASVSDVSPRPSPSANAPEYKVYLRGFDYTIKIKESYSDISVAKAQNGSSIIFITEDCDSYDWTLEEKQIGADKICLLDTSSLLAGTYSLSLEAEKSGKRYSYYAQIQVVN